MRTEQQRRLTQQKSGRRPYYELLNNCARKGRLAEISMDLFLKIGLDCSEMKQKSRKLIFTDEKNKVKFILVKASDVPTYVEYGAADIGIVGKDTLLEEGRSLYEMIDLGVGKCRMCVCGPEEMQRKISNDEQSACCVEVYKHRAQLLLSRKGAYSRNY